MSLRVNLKKRGLKDFTWKKIKIFIRYLYYLIKGDSYPELLIPEYQEQIVLRMTQVGCRPCIQKGSCLHCGCKSPQLFYDKDNECSGQNWFAMQDPETWKKHGIPIDLFYLEQLNRKGIITDFK